PNRPARFPSHPGRLATYAPAATAHAPDVQAQANRIAPRLPTANRPHTAPAMAMPSAIFAVFVTRAVEIADPRVAVPGQVRSCALGWRARASSQLRRGAGGGAVGVLRAHPRGRRAPR